MVKNIFNQIVERGCEIELLMDYIYWWEDTYEGGLKELHDEFLKVFKKAEFIPAIYNPILYNYHIDNHLKHWDREMMKKGNHKLEYFEEKLNNTLMKSVILKNMDLLIDSYEGINNIKQKIDLMDNFKGNAELKASLFLIDIYNDLLNGPYSKILQLYLKYQGEIEGKNLDQRNLRQQMQCLSTRNYDDILNKADANIRNAMSHDGVKVERNKIYFTYRDGSHSVTEEYAIYEVKDKVISLFDSVNGLIISFFKYLIENKITFNEVYVNDNIKSEVVNFFEKLSMSTLKIKCKSVEEIILRNEQEAIQINVLLEHNNLDILQRFFFGVHTAARVFTLRNLCSTDRVLVTFEADKTITSFMRVSGEIIEKFINGKLDEKEVVELIKESQDFMMYPVNEETRNKFEDLFRYYPDIECDDFVIKEIEDMSLPNKKRFRAVIYVKKVLNRKHIEKVIHEAIDKLRVLENYGFTNHKVKHGDMEADILWFVVYKKEVRAPKQRALVAPNRNFLVQVQYDKSKQFEIKNPIIDRNTHKIIENQVEYNWNPNFYKFG